MKRALGIYIFTKMCEEDAFVQKIRQIFVHDFRKTWHLFSVFYLADTLLFPHCHLQSYYVSFCPFVFLREKDKAKCRMRMSACNFL